MALDGPCPIAQVARELGLNEGTLGNWINTWKKEHAHEEHR
jgi:transposase